MFCLYKALLVKYPLRCPNLVQTVPRYMNKFSESEQLCDSRTRTLSVKRAIKDCVIDPS